MSTFSTLAAPAQPRGFAAKAGALVAGTAFASAALFGGATVAPTVTPGLTAHVQQEVTPTAFPTFSESLQNLLNAMNFGTVGDLLGVFGTGINSSSELSALLADLNPKGVTLDAMTGGLLSTDISGLLDDVKIGGNALGTIPIDTLLGNFIGGTGASEEIGTVLTALGFGPFVGLLDLNILGLSPTDTVSDVLSHFLGISSTTTLDDLVGPDKTIGGLLGITSAELSGTWNSFVDNLPVGGTLIDPAGTGTLGSETLGSLLTSLLPAADATTPVTDATTLTSLLGDLGLFGLLGTS
ncbi:hypothetical protein KIH27_09730 [Mycobacterium sp. M1]|uniref:ATPase n=1 Tax=Mycolicibacter acidiphilus TaxID=2835306 RepID=A0ABS5RHT6_9MYCO|nr:hypothetical protein [Mycolicibacter acidiphilus]MBS9533863.1 hypothetical protein [Mycolicibacter acidiphilus]